LGTEGHLSVVLFYEDEEEELSLDEYKIKYNWVGGGGYTVEMLDIDSDKGEILVQCSYKEK